MGVLKKKLETKRQRGVHIRGGGIRQVITEKIPLTLLLMLKLPSGPVLKTGGCEVVFSSQERKTLFFDKL